MMLKNLKKISLLSFILVLVLILTGCSMSPSLTLDLSPDKLSFTESEPEEELTIKISVSGFGEITVDHISTIITTEEDENPFEDFNKTIEINETFMAVDGVNREDTQTINIKDIFENNVDSDEYGDNFSDFYEEFLEGEELTLNVLLEGPEVNETGSVILDFN